MVRRKQNKTEKWLTNQHRHVTRFSLISPTKSQYQKMSYADKRKVTSIMNAWNSNSPTRKGQAISDMINLSATTKDKNGKPIITGAQKGQIFNVNAALSHFSHQRTSMADAYINQMSISKATNVAQEKKIVDNSNKVLQVGGIYKSRKDMIAVKRLNVFTSRKLTKEALSNFNKNRFKQVVENFVIYEDKTGYIVINQGAFFGKYASIDEAMDEIYTQLSGDYERSDLFAKKFGRTYTVHSKKKR